jgi:hypothetical protein
VNNQHNWMLLPFILITGLVIGWASGHLAGLLASTDNSAPWKSHMSR